MYQEREAGARDDNARSEQATVPAGHEALNWELDAFVVSRNPTSSLGLAAKDFDELVICLALAPTIASTGSWNADAKG